METGFMCRYDHGRVFLVYLFLFILSYVLFIELCVVLDFFLCGNQHYSDIELGVFGAGTLMIVL